MEKLAWEQRFRCPDFLGVLLNMVLEKIRKPELPFFLWGKYEEQTKVKHYVVSEYFDKWLKIVGSSGEVFYVDCFGGCGAYQDAKGCIWYGSPIRAAQIITSNYAELGRKAKLFVIEKDADNINNIRTIMDYLNLNVECTFINDDYNNAIEGILNGDYGYAPMFFFVDPFGFKIKMHAIWRMMELKKSEVIVNFMYNAVNRFLIEQIGDTLTDLFGCDEWKEIMSLSGDERREGIVKLYRAQLKKVAKYVFPYEFQFPTANRPYYYLYHLSNHYKGASVMKTAFAKYNYGRVRYLGSRGEQVTLFDFDEYKKGSVIDYFMKKYNKKVVRYLTVIEENIDTTDFLEREIKDALIEMEEKGLVYIDRHPKLTERNKLRLSIQEQDDLYFQCLPSVTRKSLLNPTKVEYCNYAINHIEGCAHGCVFPCYAMMMSKRFGRIKTYEDWLHPKVVKNAFMILENEIEKYAGKIQSVHLSFMTDPFMYKHPMFIEFSLKLIKYLNTKGIYVTTLTKGIYPRELSNKDHYDARNEYGITLVSLNEEFRKKFEPFSSPYEERIAALKYLHDSGCKTWVSIEPYPTPNLVKQDIVDLLNAISFVDKIVFGKINYNVTSDKFQDNGDFYRLQSHIVMSFCKEKGIECHIKSGTPCTRQSLLPT